MKKERTELHDQKARLIGIPLVGLLMTFIFDGEKLTGINAHFFLEWAQATVFTFIFWQGNRVIFIHLRRKYPHYRQTQLRLASEFFMCIAFTFVASVATKYLMSFLGKQCTLDTIFTAFLINLIPTFVVALLYESVFFFESWKANVKQTESLARENVQSQLEALKNQLDPHFLFNSLNTLASLIDYENTGAQQYLERLSDVYRYVLVSRDKNTVTLEEEMNFLDAYIYLNKVRFRENLQVVKEISPAAYRQQIAPLSLQMLVENAIKHNVISRERPLKIRILQEEGAYLSVSNNVQGKTIFEKSTKVGLQNIINRYRLLSEQPVEVKKEPDQFTVRIPLLQPVLA